MLLLDIDLLHNKGQIGTSFGLGRNDVNFNAFKPDNKVPGPGSYNLFFKVKKKINETSSTFSKAGVVFKPSSDKKSFKVDLNKSVPKSKYILKFLF
jgi:hypothetical protein